MASGDTHPGTGAGVINPTAVVCWLGGGGGQRVINEHVVHKGVSAR